jgi:hypothetical protein
MANIELLTDIFIERFVNRLDVIDIQSVWYNYEKERWVFQYKPVWQPVTRNVWYNHFKGEKTGITLGLPPLSPQGYGKWVCFDSDKDDGKLDRLDKCLLQHNWHTLREGARFDTVNKIYRPGHLWVLFDRPILGSQLRTLGSAMMRCAGVTIEELNPKQAFLKSPDEIGNVVKTPLGLHRKPGAEMARGWFEGPKKNIIAQLEWFAMQPLNSAAKAIELAHRHRPLPKPLTLHVHEYSGDKIDFIAWARDNGFTKKGDEWIGPCPSCIQNYNHDPTHEHLYVNEKKNIVHCFREQGCSFIEILNAIKLEFFKEAV